MIAVNPETQPRNWFFMRLWIFWSAVIYVTLLIGLYATYTQQPEQLQGWDGIKLMVAIGLFLASYHGIYRPTKFTWPLPYRRALLYFSIQIALSIYIGQHSRGFDGIGYALLGQVFGSLPVRQWFVPAIGLGLLIPAQLGIYDAVLQGNNLELIIFLFVAIIWAVIGLMISKLIEQSYELRQLVSELRQAKADLEASALQKEEVAALRERSRLAREMHDSIGHALVVVNVKLEAAERLYLRDAQRGAAELEATRSLVRETMADLRRSLANLRMPLLHLPTALHSLAHDLQSRTALMVELQISETLPELPGEISEVFWRVTKEALNNIEQHATATHIFIELHDTEGILRLRISDNGTGIHQAVLHQVGHYGILGMRERIEGLGGVFRITPQIDGGTLVEATVMLNH